MMFESYEHNEQSLRPETEALIANGLDFLDKAREELQAGQAKFSVVSFWTAVEILMKVPLVHEHWTLACSGKKMERKKYLAGDFQSVTCDEACARLGDVLEKPLKKETSEMFNRVKNHRNRVVHFFHNELTEGDQQQVLTEQADAWFALNRLMRDDWSPLFGRQLRDKLAWDETRFLRSSEFYAGAKFRHADVQQQIKSAVSAGGTVQMCSGCGQQAVVTDHPVVGMPLTQEQCLVCFRAESTVDVTCPGCKSISALKADGLDFVCPRCSSKHRRYEVVAENFRNRHNMCDNTPAGCTDCGTSTTVCDYGDGYLCTSCFSYFDSIEICDYCGSYSSSVPDVSIAYGCHFCDGHRQLHDDD